VIIPADIFETLRTIQYVTTNMGFAQGGMKTIHELCEYTAGRLRRINDEELLVQEGWVIYTADFSCAGKPGTVTFIRDQANRKRWHMLTDAEREATPLYVTGRGGSLPEAVAAASTAARSTCDVPPGVAP
jgi:hypothetical protein